MENKYKTTSLIFLCVSILLVVIMLIHIGISYQSYLQHPEYSASFTVNLITKGIGYGIPIIIGFVLFFIFKNKAIK